MNKRGSEELVKAIVGLALASLIVLALFGGLNKLSQAILGTAKNKEVSDSGDYFIFVKQVNNVIKTNEEKIFNLNINYDEIIFALNSDLKFKEDVTYINPSNNKKVQFNLIEKPDNCKNNEACICKCKLTETQIIETDSDKEFKCIDKTANCFILDETYSIKTPILIKQGECIELKDRGLITDYYQNNAKQFTAAMEIKLENLELNILCLNRYK